MARLYMDERELRGVGLSEPMIRTLRKLAEFVETQEALEAAQGDILTSEAAIAGHETRLDAAEDDITALEASYVSRAKLRFVS